MKTVVDNDSSSIISKVWSFCSTFTIKGKIWWELDEHRRSLHIERSEGVAARALCCSWLCLRRSAYEKVLQTMHQRILMNWSKKVSLVKWEQPAKVRTMNWNAKGSETAQRAHGGKGSSATKRIKGDKKGAKGTWYHHRDRQHRGRHQRRGHHRRHRGPWDRHHHYHHHHHHHYHHNIVIIVTGKISSRLFLKNDRRSHGQ